MRAIGHKRPLDTSDSVVGSGQNGGPVTQRAVPHGTSTGSGQTTNTITDAIVAEQTHNDSLSVAFSAAKQAVLITRPPPPRHKKRRSWVTQQSGGQTGSVLSTVEAIGATTSTTRAAGHVTSVHPYLPPAQGNAPHVTPSLGRGPATAHGLGTQPMVIDLRHADVLENGNADDDIPGGSDDGIELEPWRPVAIKAHNCPNYARNSAINYIKAILDRMPPCEFRDAQGETHMVDKRQLILEPGDRTYCGNQRSVSIRLQATGHARGEFDEQWLEAIMAQLTAVGVPTLWSSCDANDRSTIVHYTLIAREGAKIDSVIANDVVRKAMIQADAVPGRVWGSKSSGTAWGSSDLQWTGSASDYDPTRCLKLIAKGPIMCDGYQITFSPANHFVRPTSCSTMAINTDEGFSDDDYKAFARKMARTYTEWSRQSKDPSMAPYRDRKSLLDNYRCYGFWLVADASHFHFAHWLSKQDTPMGSRWTLVYHLNDLRNGYNCNVACRSNNTPTTSSRGRTQTKVIYDNISKLAGKTIRAATYPAQISPTLDLTDHTDRPGRRRERDTMPATDLSGAYPSPTSPPSTQDEDTPRRA